MPKIGIHTHNTPPTLPLTIIVLTLLMVNALPLKCTKSGPTQLSSHEVNSNNYLFLAFQQKA